MKELDLILKNIKNKEVLPIYFFHGEEAYFIDVAVKALEHNFLKKMKKLSTKLLPTEKIPLIRKFFPWQDSFR
jgi:DNA polymerase III delta subunit